MKSANHGPMGRPIRSGWVYLRCSECAAVWPEYRRDIDSPTGEACSCGGHALVEYRAADSIANQTVRNDGEESAESEKPNDSKCEEGDSNPHGVTH